MIRFAATVFLFILAYISPAQVKHYSLEPQKRNAMLQEIYSLHPVFPSGQVHDSLLNAFSYSKLPNLFTLFNNSLTYDASKDVSFHISPSLNLVGGGDLLNNDYRHNAGLGITTVFDYKKKLSLEATYRYHHFTNYRHSDNYQQKNRVLPGGPLPTGNTYHNLRFDMHWRPSQYFHFSGGFDEHFIGNGYRSLMLSDAGYAYPFFNINTTIWHINYNAMWINMKDFRDPSINRWGSFKDKYAAIHYLSWQITPRLRAGFYEAIIWQGTNEQGDRGLEINYLNPIIFFRPVEFAIGSPDNAMMGIDIDYRIGNQLLYMQLMLDEFKYEEMKAMDGWWGNKQAMQLGWRSFDVMSIENLHTLVEYNFIRPYMYSHRTPLQSYGNYNQPLAHPAGANVMEGIFNITYSKDRVYLALKNTFSIFGTNPAGKNYGGDIFLDYNTRSKEYNNYVGQGITNKLQNHVAELSYLLNKDNRLTIFCRAAYRNHRVEDVSNKGLFFEAGISNTPGAAGNSWINY
jgi:hypothetical protein